MATEKTTSTAKSKAGNKPEADEVKTSAPQRRRLTLADVPLTELVEVQSCFYGTLTYTSVKTGYNIEWNEFGATQYIPVEELLTMRNTQPAFFTNQWVRLLGDNASDVINFLQLEKYYSKTADFEDFDDIFSMTPAKIEATVETFTDSMKESFARYAVAMVANGTLDSVKKIGAIEKATGFKLDD